MNAKTMAIELDLQVAFGTGDLPTEEDFGKWVAAALDQREQAELTIRIVDREESRMLNHTYRDKDSDTNVLSFPADLPDSIEIPLLGDIVICAPRVAQEASAQNTHEQFHWAHLTVHGVLHLLGFDHQEDEEAEIMEAMETSILASLGFPDPYSWPPGS